MSLLVRKFARSKWSKIENKDRITKLDIPADPITRCLATTENKLSFWEIENNDNMSNEKLDEIMKDISLNINLLSNDINTTHILIFDKNELIEDFNISNSTVKTVLNINAKHCDITDITISTLGNLSLKIINKVNLEELNENCDIVTYSKSDLKKHLESRKEFINSDKVNIKIREKEKYKKYFQ